MAEAFHRDRRGQIVANIDRAEALLLQHLLDEVAEILTTDQLPKAADMDPLMRDLGLSDLAGCAVAEPQDPVVRRLLPAGYSGDSQAADEFRRYTDTSLRTGKIADARLMKETLDRAVQVHDGRLMLDQQQAQVWLRAINDLRLALGTRLDVVAEAAAEAAGSAEDHQDAMAVALYDFLTWWQESLVWALMPE